MSDSRLRIAFVADGRAEHARQWVEYFSTTGDTVLLLSTYPCEPLNNVRLEILPGVFRPGNVFVKSSQPTNASDKKSLKSKTVDLLLRYGIDSMVRPIWHRFSTVDVLRQSIAVKTILAEFEPDLVHALRITNEAFALSRINDTPKIASVWGQDLFYNCKHYGIQRFLARRCLPQLDALTADCSRDIRLAREYGFKGVSEYFPTNGGVDSKIYFTGEPFERRNKTIVYARGYGPYLRPEVLFASVRKLIESSAPYLKLIVIAPDSQIGVFKERLRTHKIPDENVEIKRFQTSNDWANILRNSLAYVSPSVSDGTPNGMLEAMACGALPIMGNIESIREWISHGSNGLLFEPESVSELAACISRCLQSAEMHDRAMKENRELVEKRCARDRVFPKIRSFYEQLALKQAMFDS